MNTIIIVASVLLVALAGAARAQLEANQVQECVDTFVEVSAGIQIPAEIERATLFVRSQDTAGSTSMLKILEEQEVDFTKFEEQSKLDSLKETAANFLNVVASNFPSYCKWDPAFLEHLKIHEDSTHKASEFFKLIDCIQVCVTIDEKL